MQKDSRGVDDNYVRGRLLDQFNIEIAGGLGNRAGRAWRIGLMGRGVTHKNVAAVNGGLQTVLADARANA